MSDIDRQGDDELITRLREGLAQADPVPVDVIEFAGSALAWRDVDVVLAATAFDSMEEGAVTGLRSTSLPRVMTFDTERGAVDVEYDEKTHVLMGQTTAGGPITVEMRLGGRVLTTEPDERGRFQFETVSPGPMCLLITLRDGVVIKTEWTTL